MAHKITVKEGLEVGKRKKKQKTNTTKRQRFVDKLIIKKKVRNE